MFKHMLVPLDGSVRAEQAIPVAARIARANGGSLLLLRVFTPPVQYGIDATYSGMLTEDILEAGIEDADTYLAKIAASPTLKHLTVRTRVEEGLPAMTMFTIARDEAIDLIVMCSHGYTGFKRLALGSMAQNVAWHSPVPVLVLHEKGSQPTESYPDRRRPLRPLVATVALDGSRLAETALEPASYLVAALAAPARGGLILTRVVTLPVSSHGASISQEKAREMAEAKTYLDNVAACLSSALHAQGLDLTITTYVATGKDAAATLTSLAENKSGAHPCGTCDVLVLTTHGRGGLQRMALGSVTARVLGATSLPLLIVRAGQGASNTNRQLAYQAAKGEG